MTSATCIRTPIPSPRAMSIEDSCSSLKQFQRGNQPASHCFHRDICLGRERVATKDFDNVCTPANVSKTRLHIGEREKSHRSLDLKVRWPIVVNPAMPCFIAFDCGKEKLHLRVLRFGISSRFLETLNFLASSDLGLG